MVDNSGFTRRPQVKRITGIDTIVYCCRACKTIFEVYRDRELFCHNCGCKQDWRATKDLNLSVEDIKRFLNASYEDREALVAALDKRVLEYEDDTPSIS